jgi:hypothetical protein
LDGRQRRSDSFVVRIWWEEGDGLPTWRGWVQHASSGQVDYFQHLVELLSFVEAYTGPLAQTPDATVEGRGREDVVDDG